MTRRVKSMVLPYRSLIGYDVSLAADHKPGGRGSGSIAN